MPFFLTNVNVSCHDVIVNCREVIITLITQPVNYVTHIKPISYSAGTYPNYSFN